MGLRNFLERTLLLCWCVGEYKGTSQVGAPHRSAFAFHWSEVSQEKAVLEQHIAWLREDLSAKSAALLNERRARADAESELQAKLSQVTSAADPGLEWK